MKKQSLIVFISLSVMMGLCNTNCKAEKMTGNASITSEYFNTIRAGKDNAQLALFFAQMPKGGDIHHHYPGAVYAETYLDWASRDYCLKIDSLILKKDSGSCPGCISMEDLKKNTALFRTVLETWSDLNYSDHFHLQEQPDQHFFNTFGYFAEISNSNFRAGLKEIKERAKTENVQYIETMFASPDTKVCFRKTLIDSLVEFGTEKDITALNVVFTKLSESIRSESTYKQSIDSYLDSLRSYHENIDDQDFTMRFQTYAYRNSSPDAVFRALYSSFDAVARDKSSLLVGVNILGPENLFVAMKDYWLHMQMFHFLKRNFNNVKTSLHAGELAMGMVKPEDLTYHIDEAVNMAGASRIGHGVDIPYEKNSFKILKKMQSDKIAVEINLTSNEFILGIKGKDHPINIYNRSRVPIVICTDDAGVSRNNLTTEYVKLASRYDFTYGQIKEFVYNSIKYSFMNEKDKESVLKSLTFKFANFESNIADFLAAGNR